MVFFTSPSQLFCFLMLHQLQKVELDPDSEEGSIVKTYELRERDEWRDQHKAGEGNRYNMG
eukprot:m.21598 g.21598  ORF g.21598 m.21598 type:complete len:61 (-) comp8736_c0_seq2:265-447(-)